MCGIVGCFHFKKNTKSDFKINKDYLIEMRETMIHRGPDDGGFWISPEENMGLAHRRLSIIDLSKNATQPMLDSSGQYAIVFNGEIYNHREIKEDLKKEMNIQWQTDHSDTEVLLYAYKLWGKNCLKKLRGMFAFAVWNEEKSELFLARDRIGIKPLYYTIVEDRFVFASEIKALLKDKSYKPRVNEESFYHYLSFLTAPAPQTLFEGISKLRAGHSLLIKNDGKIFEEQYWDVFDNKMDFSGKSENFMAESIKSKLSEAVICRKIGDVPVGVFLSGGIDSSTNAALFSDGGHEKIKTFSIGYNKDYGSYPNELHFAEEMAKTINSDHYEKRLNVDDLMDFLPEMIRLQDEPLADPVCFPVYYVSKLARENGVKVCQVGEGADELFWGYSSWKIKLKLQKYNKIPFLTPFKNLGLIALKCFGKSHTFQYEFLRRGIKGEPVFWGGAESFTERQKKILLSDRLKKKFDGYSSWEVVRPIYEDFKSKNPGGSDLDWMSYLDLKMRLPELLLMRVDKMAMGNSLEARVPFLDHEFVELAMSLPESVKTKNNVSKYILKKAVRGLIPDRLIDRKKQGFGVPVYEWLFDKLGNQIEKETLEFCDETDFFDKESVQHLMTNKSGHQLWYLYNFVLWHKTYIQQ